jgi:hypothetical protein
MNIPVLLPFVGEIKHNSYPIVDFLPLLCFLCFQQVSVVVKEKVTFSPYGSSQPLIVGPVGLASRVMTCTHMANAAYHDSYPYLVTEVVYYYIRLTYVLCI